MVATLDTGCGKHWWLDHVVRHDIGIDGHAIGIVANLFTSVWLSRSMFDFLVNRRQAATLSI